LQILALEVYGCAQLFAEVVGVDQLGAAHPFFQPVKSFMDQCISEQ
jgi:hypothetical protein